MSKKTEKPIRPSVLLTEKILTKLEGLDGITTKSMFGGTGFMHEGKMFGFVSAKGIAFFKVDDSNRGDYEKAAAEKHHRMPYYTVPEKVMSNARSLKSWAKKAIAVTKG